MLICDNAQAEACPVLAKFLKEEHEMRSLTHLPKVMEFINLLLTRFNRRLTKDGARKMTVAQVCI